MELSSNPSTTEEFDPFLDVPDEFYHDSLLQCSSPSRRRSSGSNRNPICSDVATEPSSSSDGFEADGKSNDVEVSDELEVGFETSEEDSDVIKPTNDISPENENDLDVIDVKDMDATDSGRNRVDPFQEETSTTGEKPEDSTVTTVSDDPVESAQTQLRETSSSNWSLLGFLAVLMVKAIEFQVGLMISFMSLPLWFLNCCSLFVSDPFSAIRLGTMSRFKLSWLKDTKQILNVACKFGWGLLWAVYVAIVLFGLLVSALMLGGFMINRIAVKPFVVKESLNFDYTKNSPEAFVAITSCAAGVGSSKESSEMWMIRGLRVIPQGHKLDITLSMTLPESSYNKNLGMFQVRVDFLSADGQMLDSIRRPCMLRFRSEPIRLIQTFLKVVPLVTGYVSEIQTLSLKLKGFVEKDIPTACLKIMIEQRAEFRPGAGIPELYDASLSLESNLPFFKRILWKWRNTLFVWISMSLFITELLFALVCCRPLIIPRRWRRDRSSLNQRGNR